MKIGIFGGSFDPIHQGHLILAECCRESAGLDQVWFIPCALQPHKQQGAQATDKQRCEMIGLALAGYQAFHLSRQELERGGVSYTLDTLEQIHAGHPDDELFLIMGDDSLESFSSWKNPKRICELAVPLVVNRPGSGEIDLTVLKSWVDDQRYHYFESARVECPQIEISSREIKASVAAGRSIRYLTPRAVEKYIQTQKIYSS